MSTKRPGNELSEAEQNSIGRDVILGIKDAVLNNQNIYKFTNNNKKKKKKKRRRRRKTKIE